MLRTMKSYAVIAMLLATMLGAATTGTGVASATTGARSRPTKGHGILIGPVNFDTGAWDVKGPAIESHLGASWVEVVGNLSSESFVSRTTALDGAGAFTTVWASNVANPTAVCPQHGFLFDEPYENIQTITGGNHRFAGATGTLDVKGCFGVDSSKRRAVLTFTLNGTMN